MATDNLQRNLVKLQALEDLTCRLFTLEKIPMEEKILAAAEERISEGGLEPWEISEIVTHALHELQHFLPSESVDVAFDVIYDAISEAVKRAQGLE